MKTRESIPNAPILIESLRSLGYSFETAIADLIDNCISARAKNIRLLVDPSGEPTLVILDDGYGMDASRLEEAFRFGSKNPLEKRDDRDLGRFGLGLKAASLSQCRELVVASKVNGVISCFSWNLDHVIEAGDWSIIEFSEDEINELPYIDMLRSLQETGTYVLLRNFDRLRVSTNDLRTTFTKKINETVDHLSLVFHRIIKEDGVNISYNNTVIEPRDPFLEDNKATQKLRMDEIRIKNEKIFVQPYILPHINKLTKEDEKKVGGNNGKDDLRTNQGFYIYRCKRLIIWGTWFRLRGKNELQKLARVKVDIPNTLDDIWNIDVKKSTAELPEIIRRELEGCVNETIFTSKRVIGYRGERHEKDDCIRHIWQRYDDRDGGIYYQLNRDLPQVKALFERLDEKGRRFLGLLLELIEDNIPLNQIYYDVANDGIRNTDVDIEKMKSAIRAQLKYADDFKMTREELLEVLLAMEPYVNYAELKKNRDWVDE